MPVSDDEAKKIIGLVQSYLPFHHVVGLFRRLHYQVGYSISNECVKEALAKMHKITSEAWEEMEPNSREPIRNVRIVRGSVGTLNDEDTDK